MESNETYTSMVQPRGKAYLDSQIVGWSHYDDPIDRSPGRPAGNSRIWGDASPEAQSRVIDALITSSERAGLSPRETAYVLATARVESGFNLDAAAGTTSATGLGQFIDKTGASYGINDGNRSNLTMQADALVAHFQENEALAKSRGQGEEYIYKYHHDGPSKDYGGLKVAEKDVMPYLDKYEKFVQQHEQKYGIAERGPSLAEHHTATHAHHSHHSHAHHAGAPGTLEEGAHGPSVKELQTKLAGLGYLDAKDLTGNYGPHTRSAVERFQDDHNLKTNGIADAKTTAAVDEAAKKAEQAQGKAPQGAGDKAPGAGEKAQGTSLLSDPKNPDHALYEQALAGVHKLDAAIGRTPDQHSANLAAALVVQAKAEGMTRIDQVQMSPDGSKTFAAQNTAPMKAVAEVPTLQSLNTPMQQSSVAAQSAQPSPTPTPTQNPNQSQNNDQPKAEQPQIVRA